jgi:hypothetical protein
MFTALQLDVGRRGVNRVAVTSSSIRKVIPSIHP